MGELWRKVEVTLTDDGRQPLPRDALSVNLAVPVKATPASLKLVAYDYGADLVGSLNVNVKK